MKTETNTNLPKYVLNLLKAAKAVEAHSHIDLEANEYHVDVLAMANLCGALGNRKFNKIQYDTAN
jgi:hypothetical protein